MASLAKTYTDEKLNGRIYTPQFIVNKILDDIGYNSDSTEILGKRILDPACGDGRFLCEVVRRICINSPKHLLNKNLQCVHGWDIDAAAVKECIANINKVTNQFGAAVNHNNIAVANSIKKHNRHTFFNTDNQFDYIAGNPPYIRIQHLDIEQRQYIQQHYDFCKSGSTDIYIAFYELCLHLLSENGICGLITPNTFLHTEAARTMRQHFAANASILQITNYGGIQLFDNASTYSAIVIFNKDSNENFVYQKAVNENGFQNRVCKNTELREPFWQLSISETLPEDCNKQYKTLKEICKIHVGLTTLCDSAYIFPLETGSTVSGSRYVNAKTKFCGIVKLEKDILKPIIKGSKLKHPQQAITEYILFPYKKHNGRHIIIPEDELRKEYPLAYGYLLSVKPELDKRDNGRVNPVSWYAFGRSQGLDTSFGAKIIFSPMNHKPNFVYYANPDCTFYSGYCIKFDGNVNELLTQLNSVRMQEFVASSSRDFRGGWKAYNKKIVGNYKVKLV